MAERSFHVQVQDYLAAGAAIDALVRAQPGTGIRQMSSMGKMGFNMDGWDDPWFNSQTASSLWHRPSFDHLSRRDADGCRCPQPAVVSGDFAGRAAPRQSQSGAEFPAVPNPQGRGFDREHHFTGAKSRSAAVLKASRSNVRNSMGPSHSAGLLAGHLAAAGLRYSRVPHAGYGLPLCRNVLP